MKEKIKNFFKNEKLWATIVEILISILLVCVGYFSGFSAGLLVDDSIRTKIIEKAVDEPKINSKSKLIKKAIEPSEIPTYEASVNIKQSGSFNIGVVKSTSSARFVMLDYIVSIGQTDGDTNNVSYTIDVDVSLSETFNNSSYDDSNVVRDSYTHIFFTSFTGTHDISLEYLKHFQCNFIPSVFKGTNLNGAEKLYFHLDVQLDFTAVNNSMSYEEIRFEDYVIDGFNTSNLAFITTNDYYVMFYNVNSQLRFYYNGYTEGYDNGEKKGIEEGKKLGYEERKDSVEDTEQRINSVWTILEKAITSVLNVLSFEILPGIPLYICVGVPVLLAVLLWFIKMGQS